MVGGAEALLERALVRASARLGNVGDQPPSILFRNGVEYRLDVKDKLSILGGRLMVNGG